MKSKIRATLDNMHLSDIYSLMLFVMYKVQDIPEYAVLSELCYLLDSANLTRLLTYFSGKTITIPSQEDFVVLSNALLLYQYVSLDGLSLAEGQSKLKVASAKQREQITNLYLQILPIMKQYNIDREQLQSNGR